MPPLIAQDDAVIRFSRQVPKVEFISVVGDGRGDLYALGRSNDATFVVPRDAAQPRLVAGSCSSTTNYPCYDVVVARFRGSDGEMIAATFLGGAGDETPSGLAVDGQGYVYVTGTTTSRNFPLTTGAVSTAPPAVGVRSGFVTKFNPTLTGAVFSMYLGGSANTRMNGIAVDRFGNAYVTGTTDARNFPVTPGAYQTTGGVSAAFATKINSNGTALMASTFLGPISPAGIGADPDGGIVVGGTFHRSGASDLFIIRLNPGGTAAVPTFFGQPSNDQATDLMVDPAGNVYLSGITYSATFPGSNPTLGEVGRGFVLKFTGSSVAWFASLRANGLTTVTSLELAADGSIAVTGTTSSTHFPTTPGAYRRCVAPDFNGAPAPFFARIDKDGVLRYSTYVYESSGAPRWAVTLPTGDLITMSRLQTSVELPPNIVRRYAFSSVPTTRIDCTVNAASYRTAAVTPGMVVTLFGSDMGPATGVEAAVEGGKLPTSVAGVRVLFNGIAAPLLYVRQDQINAVVPSAVAGSTSAQIRVEYEGKSIAPIAATVKNVDPGMFRLGSSEFGVVLNEDRTLNTPDNPAVRGSYVTFWATGMGAYETAYQDGAIIGADATAHRLPVKISFAGVEGPLLYAGSAPDMVAGVTQVNVRIPANARPSLRTPVSVAAGESTAIDSAYISIK